MRENPFIDALEHAEQKIVELRAELHRWQFLFANANGYADLLEEAAKHVPNELDAGLLRGLADKLRELEGK